jgi:GxxExxY protein
MDSTSSKENFHWRHEPSKKAHGPAVNQNYEDSEITSKIIGCAMRVHNQVGCGFQEIIYQRSLAIELKKAGISCVLEFEMPIYYDEERVGSRRVDILVEGRIPVELKAVVELDNTHLAQAKNYLEAYKLRVGLLINFGETSLQFRRFINSKAPLSSGIK